jgi:hypothetical protein
MLISSNGNENCITEISEPLMGDFVCDDSSYRLPLNKNMFKWFNKFHDLEVLYLSDMNDLSGVKVHSFS